MFLIGLPVPVHAQQANPHDAFIEAMRSRPDFGASDQRHIADWVQAEMAPFRGFSVFRKRFEDQYRHPNNSPAFRLQLATKTAEVARARFAAADFDQGVAHALAQVLVDMKRPETLPGLMAGLRSRSAIARYLCVKGLAAQRRAIAADKDLFPRVIAALRQAGLAESDPVVLGRIYDALAYDDQIEAVFDVYIALFDKRLEFRRGPAMIADGAERTAWEFFRRPRVLNALNADQKVQLVARLGVFLRLDAQRYDSSELPFEEIDRLERMLDGEEEILVRLAGSGGGKIRDQLAAGGHTKHALVLQEAYKWVGDPEKKGRGPLNEKPWSLPLGAP